MGEVTGGGGAAGNEAREDGAVVIAEEDAVDFWAQSTPPSSEDAATWCGTPTIPGNRYAVNLPCQTSRAYAFSLMGIPSKASAACAFPL